MLEKPSFIRAIRFWGVLTLLFLSVLLPVVTSYKSVQITRQRAEQMRKDYELLQRQMTKAEVERVASVVDHEIHAAELQTRTHLKIRVDDIYAVTQSLYRRHAGKQSDAEIEQLVLSTLDQLIYDNDNVYFFIIQNDGSLILNDTVSQAELSPAGAFDVKRDKHKIVDDLLSIAQNRGEGYLKYHWSKASSAGRFEKISFVKHFAPFDWVIGSGMYVDDIEQDLQSVLIDYVNTHRFGPNMQGYVFINEILDINGGNDFARVYANPNRPDDKGKMLSDDYQDADGRYFRRAFLKGLRQKGECFVTYSYKKLDNAKSSEKTSFFKLAGQGRFMVAAGIYLDDVESHVAAMVEREQGRLYRTLVIIFSVIIASLLAVSLFWSRINRKLSKDFETFDAFLIGSAEETIFIDRRHLQFKEFDLLAAAANITAQKRIDSDKELRLAAGVFENTSDGIFITDADMKLLAVNPAFTQISGYAPDEVLGLTPHFLRADINDSDYLERIRQQIEEDGRWNGELWNRSKNGSVYPVRKSLSAITDENNQVVNYVGVFADITKAKEATDRLAHMAHHHPLTDLPNRLLLYDRLAQSIAYSRRNGVIGAVMFLDMDNFKVVNDTLGHAAGDQLLVEVAARLKGCHRNVDTVSHLAGDEFVIILDNIGTHDNACDNAQKVLDALSHTYVIEDRSFELSASIGLALFPEHGINSEMLLKNADIAMYKAKQTGKNCYRVFSPMLLNEQITRT